jgi:hypothetical protein
MEDSLLVRGRASRKQESPELHEKGRGEFEMD